MKIGKLVHLFIPKIFAYCEKHDSKELNRLMDLDYSKSTFHLSSYPFCSPSPKILKEQSIRYWADEFDVLNKTVRVCSQWTIAHKEYFVQYLLEKGIATQTELQNEFLSSEEYVAKQKQQALRKNSRFKNSAIGNAQNLFIRNILSHLGNENFTKNDWEETKQFFFNSCAYCGSSDSLEIEHAIPINKKNMGEHRLGNLVPSCKSCNKRKASKDFRDFLGENEGRIQKIELYMKSRGYASLETNEQVAELLEMAYREVADVAARYITIINRVLEK